MIGRYPARMWILSLTNVIAHAPTEGTTYIHICTHCCHAVESVIGVLTWSVLAAPLQTDQLCVCRNPDNKSWLAYCDWVCEVADAMATHHEITFGNCGVTD